jgi:hypothetical protein
VSDDTPKPMTPEEHLYATTNRKTRRDMRRSMRRRGNGFTTANKIIKPLHMSEEAASRMWGYVWPLKDKPKPADMERLEDTNG